jgi:hypothetical protein
METNGRLIFALLRKLAEIEKTAADGRAVQPAMDRSVADPITADGYGWEAVNEHLQKLIEYSLVDASELALGIFFKRLTDKGHGVLAEGDAMQVEPDWISALPIEAREAASRAGATALKYSQFEDKLLSAIVEASEYVAAGGNPKGQVEVFEAAEHAGLERKENWISDAVTNFENQGFVFNVARPLGHPLRTIVMVTAEGRKHAEFLHSRNPF